jgi:endoglucanase
MKTKFFSFLVLIALLLNSGISNAQVGYLHRDGKKIVDGDGTEVILKGLNFGNSMVQEGYMMNTSGSAGTQHEIKAKLKALLGDSLTTEFYKAWLNNHVTKADIDSIKSWGMNSVRIPIHYEYFTSLTEDVWYDWGFNFLDSIITWCTQDEIYAIIDLHAAPGGQGTNAYISDYDSSKPSLWHSMANKNKTVALWGEIAARYKNEQWVGGYDLINETNNDDPNNVLPIGANNDSLLILFKRITKEIRKTDSNHILFIEGNGFANDFNGLTPTWDFNMAYSFHKYWTANNQGVIQWMLDIRNTYNVPIWCGETGENGNYNFTQEMELFNTNGIGVAWWPMKKFDATNSFVSCKWPANYSKILNYFTNAANKPTVGEAYAILTEFANNLNIQNVKVNKDMVYAIMTQPGNRNYKPFADHHIPGKIALPEFDLGTNTATYYDKVSENTSGTADGGTWNSGGKFRNDGVDIEVCTDAYSNGFNIGWTETGEWTKYTVTIDSTGVYNASFRVASANAKGGYFHIELNDKDVTGTIRVNNTGGWTSWQTVSANGIFLEAGVDTLKFYVDKLEFNINSMTWTPSGDTIVPFRILSAKTSADGSQIFLRFNKNLIQGTGITGTTFSLETATTPITIDNIEYSDTDPQMLIFNITEDVIFSDLLSVSYNDNVVISNEEDTLGAFTDFYVINNLPTRLIIPGRIQAEAYTTMVGMTLETCEDSGGGQDLGYTNVGDYTEYLVYVNDSATYTVEFRTAGTGTGRGEISLMDNGTKTVLGTAIFNTTGDWQTWNTYTTDVFIPKGNHTLRFQVLASGFNFNFMNFKKSTAIPVLESEKLSLYPNPSKGLVNINNITENATIEVVDIAGKVCHIQNLQKLSGTQTIDLNNLQKGFYIVRIQSGNSNISQKLILE